MKPSERIHEIYSSIVKELIRPYHNDTSFMAQFDAIKDYLDEQQEKYIGRLMVEEKISDAFRERIEKLEAQMPARWIFEQGEPLKCAHGIALDKECETCNLEPAYKTNDEMFAKHWYERGYNDGKREMKVELKKRFDIFFNKRSVAKGSALYILLREELFNE